MPRRIVTVRGIVQGVGFRPFVFSLATRLGLNGSVCNAGGGVDIEVEGDDQRLDQFLAQLERYPPRLARIESVSWQSTAPLGDVSFRIVASQTQRQADLFVAPDVATCDDCLRELFDPTDRRFRYPFINCVNCGPRLTIIRGAPYDRSRTAMAEFPMCDDCRAEYEDPANRRFHAEPTCCPRCGPQLTFDERGSAACTGDAALIAFAQAIRAGRIGLLKGLGGFHLVCDATSDAAVATLRQRKQRDERAFALMVRDLNVAQAVAECQPEELTLLASTRRPIVLVRRRASALAQQVSSGVAPDTCLLGLMLPYTPLHHLLLHELGSLPVVMTSGNRSDEPMAYRDDDARLRLGALADMILTHNRPIEIRCDDSVTRWLPGSAMARGELPLRRARGHAPAPLPLLHACDEPILAVGGQLKNVFALGRGKQAFLSHHFGDLDHWEAAEAFRREIPLLEKLLLTTPPALLVHDAHPDYVSTQYAAERAARDGTRLVAVQHHHAHLASCMAEHGLDEPVIGITLDGTGYGLDRVAGQPTIWGGEILVGDYGGFRRAAHLRYVPLLGGEQAIKQPWRMALAQLWDAGLDERPLRARLSDETRRVVRTMWERDLSAPRTSSAGRLFDAVASLAGIRDISNYEAQAAQHCEWRAQEFAQSRIQPDGRNALVDDSAALGDYPFVWQLPKSDEEPYVLDTRELIRAIVEDLDRGAATAEIAWRFHRWFVVALVDICARLRATTGLERVVLSGGVFFNVLLTTWLVERLEREGFCVHRHRLVPTGDGGLALGQLAIAAAGTKTSPRPPSSRSPE